MKNIFVYMEKAGRIVRQKYNRFLWGKNVEGLGSIGENSYMDRPYVVTGAKYIQVGRNFHCGMGSRIQAIDEFAGIKYKPRIVIGNNVSINMNAEISAINEIVIEDGVQLASNVLIVDHFHGRVNNNQNLKMFSIRPSTRELYTKGPVRICQNVWIGYGVAVMPGVVIGEGSLVGANSVITKDVPPYTVVAGVPGKVIRELKAEGS